MIESLMILIFKTVGGVSAVSATVLLSVCVVSLMKNALGHKTRHLLVFVFKRDPLKGDRMFFYAVFLVLAIGVSWTSSAGITWVGFACLAELLARAMFFNLGIEWRGLGYGKRRPH